MLFTDKTINSQSNYSGFHFWESGTLFTITLRKVKKLSYRQLASSYGKSPQVLNHLRP